jgi:hypothetical protein
VSTGAPVFRRSALSTLNLTLRGAPPELKFRLDAEVLALGQNYTFEVDGEYPLDFLGYLEPIGTTISYPTSRPS